MMNIFACNHRENQIVGNDRPLIVVKNDRCQKFKSKLMAASQQSVVALFSLLQLPIASVIVQS